MKSGIKKFILTLIVLTSFVGIINLLCECFYNNIINFRPILYFLYCFTPLVSLLIMDPDIFKKTISKYMSLKSINYVKCIFIILKIVVFLPLLSLIFIYFFGNILEIREFGIISTKTISIAVSVIPIYLIMGFTYYAIIAFGGEIIWRGFLENSISSDSRFKYLIIGGIWWVWYFASTVFFRINYKWSDLIVESIVTLFLFFILSFYLGNMVKKTGTILLSSITMGLLSSSSILYSGIENFNQLLNGNNSVVTILVISLFLLLSFIPPAFNRRLKL